MRRINVVGTSCSGKTTLARALARRLDLPHIEVDALFWGSGWTPLPPDVFRQRLTDALAAAAWVADGGYEAARDITWSRTDTVVWLDYPMPLVLGRWARRTVRRIRTQEEFWPGTGNRGRFTTRFGATACSGGSSARIAAAANGCWREWWTGPTSSSSACARHAKPMPGSLRSRLRAASTRCRRRSARASRSAAAP